jgi:hypothetical protein
MSSRLLTIHETAALIQSGQPLLLAGDEAALRRLPHGPWIGGTIPYFMGEAGGLSSRELVQVTPLPGGARIRSIQAYAAAALERVYLDAPDVGFSVIILPASSPAHLSFALKAPGYPGFATRPLIGWVSGTALEDLGQQSAKVVDGRTGSFLEKDAVVMHIELPPTAIVDIGIINLFEPGDGEGVRFLEDGFSARRAHVNGQEVDFADHVRAAGINTQLPLVADMAGAMINTSFKAVGDGQVDFYAPVFRGVDYKVARPVGDYVAEFQARMPALPKNSLSFSCNCILNYLYAGLEGRSTQPFTGPITFGEVAYQLLNQTLVYLTVE